MSFFEDSLTTFVKDFAYGDAIRHLSNHNFTAEQIKKELQCSMSLSAIQKIMDEHRQTKLLDS